VKTKYNQFPKIGMVFNDENLVFPRTRGFLTVNHCLRFPKANPQNERLDVVKQLHQGNALHRSTDFEPLSLRATNDGVFAEKI